ncbi:alpha/beta hydrolase [uncultured Microbacterium sp.]|uniref:alpha/beta hydrolase n=1 Tax=uncultured Microbacterium sp. TaxID=191216 RepID=UPI0035CB25C9
MNESQRMLALLNEQFPDIASLPPARARAVVDARVTPPRNLDDVARTEDHSVRSGARTVTVRVYFPHAPRTSVPATVYAHGGGFLHGSIASHDGFCRRWSRATASVVVSVEYALAPEHSAPDPTDDMIAAVGWTRAHDWGRRIVVAGDSAGGNVAASAAVALAERGDSPLVGQVLIYPMLDPGMSSASYRTRGEGYFITARTMEFYWRTYLGGAPADRAADPLVDPTAAAAAAAVSLPPAIVVTGGLDPLHDEGRDHAGLLRDRAVPCIYRTYPDQFHGFLTIPEYGPGIAASALLWADFAHMFTEEDA